MSGDRVPQIWFGRNDEPHDFTRCESCQAPFAEYGMLYRSFCSACMKSLAERILADVATLPANTRGSARAQGSREPISDCTAELLEEADRITRERSARALGRRK